MRKKGGKRENKKEKKGGENRSVTKGWKQDEERETKVKKGRKSS